MNVGVIGVGVQGSRYARVYSELKMVDNVYVFDSYKDRMIEVSNRYGCVPSKDIDTMINDVDAVSICTPTSTHANFVEMMISDGVPFIVEKPFTDDFSLARKLIDLKNTTSGELICGVGHIERFNPIVGEIKDLIHHPKYVEIKRHNPSSVRGVGVTNVVDDLMIHDIDVIFNVFFKSIPYTIQAVGNRDVCSVIFKFFINDEIVPVYLSASRMASRKTRSIYIENSQWTIDGNYMTQEVYIHRYPRKYVAIENKTYHQESVVDKVELGKIEPLRVELKTFLECVLTGSNFPITLEESAENVEICETIKKIIGV